MKNATISMDEAVADQALGEDLQHEQQVDRVRVVNPFRTAPEALGLTGS